MVLTQRLPFTLSLRSFFYGLAAIALVLVLIGAGGAFWLLSKSPLSLLRGGQESSPTAAMFVPRQAPMMVSLLVNPDRLQTFRQVVARPADRRRARAELNQFRQNLLANTGLNYQRDVQPWLGNEVTLAVTTPDVDRDRQNGEQPGYLLIAASQNPERSREFLQLFWQKRALAGNNLVFEQYKGVKLIYAESEVTPETLKAKNQGKAGRNQEVVQSGVGSQQTPALASAVVGDRFLLFANYPKVLRDAINNVQASELNLANSSFYQRALKSLKQDRIGLSFVNVPALADWVGGESSQTADEASAEALPTTYESLAIALGLDRQGLLAETALIASSNYKVSANSPRLSDPVAALKYIPATSPVSASGTDLNQLWQQISAALNGYPPVAQLVNQPLATLQTRWKLDLPQDIFSWVTGEYALGLLPQANPANPDWIFVAEKSPQAQASIDQLDAIARQQGLSVGPLTLAGQSIAAWTELKTAAGNTNNARTKQSLNLEANVRGVHASVGSYEIFTTSIEAMDQALKATQEALVENQEFQRATAPLAAPNNGYLYLDWTETQAILERQLPIFQVVDLVGKPFLSHVQSVTLSSYGSEPGIQRGGAFIRLSSL